MDVVLNDMAGWRVTNECQIIENEIRDEDKIMHSKLSEDNQVCESSSKSTWACWSGSTGTTPIALSCNLGKAKVE